MSEHETIETTATEIANTEITPAMVQEAKKKAGLSVEVQIGEKGLTPTDMGGLWRLAQMVGKSGLAPDALRTPEAIFVAMSHGLEIGLRPMQSLQSIAVINGRPSIWGDAMIGLVLASGLVEDYEETFEGVEGTDDYKAVFKITRKGMKEAVNKFSVKDAIRAGHWEKSMYKKHPKRMLQLRARAFGLRNRFADVLGGLYMAEELQGEELRTRIVDNTTGDDDLADALAVPQLPPSEDPEPSEGHDVGDINPADNDSETPFDVDGISDLMDK